MRFPVTSIDWVKSYTESRTTCISLSSVQWISGLALCTAKSMNERVAVCFLPSHLVLEATWRQVNSEREDPGALALPSMNIGRSYPKPQWHGIEEKNQVIATARCYRLPVPGRCVALTACPEDPMTLWVTAVFTFCPDCPDVLVCGIPGQDKLTLLGCWEVLYLP